MANQITPEAIEAAIEDCYILKHLDTLAQATDRVMVFAEDLHNHFGATRGVKTKLSKAVLTRGLVDLFGSCRDGQRGRRFYSFTKETLRASVKEFINNEPISMLFNVSRGHDSKQGRLERYLRVSGYPPDKVDQFIDGAEDETLCRPDFQYIREHHVVIIECDENQHATHPGGKVADMARMITIGDANFPKKTIFLRFNPDDFKSGDITVVATYESKHDGIANIEEYGVHLRNSTLLDDLKYHLGHSREDLEEFPMVCCYYYFFDHTDSDTMAIISTAPSAKSMVKKISIDNLINRDITSPDYAKAIENWLDSYAALDNPHKDPLLSALKKGNLDIIEMVFSKIYGSLMAKNNIVIEM